MMLIYEKSYSVKWQIFIYESTLRQKSYIESSNDFYWNYQYKGKKRILITTDRVALTEDEERSGEVLEI